MLKKLLQSSDINKLEEILSNVLKLNIKKIEYDKKIKMRDVSEYEFDLIKVKTILSTDEEIEMYLKMVKKSKIKESIFCYWCSIYEEELTKMAEKGKREAILNKVLISELNKKKYQQSIFLEIENNKLPILETGTEVNFLEIIEYIKEYTDSQNKYDELLKYFDKNSDDTLLIGIKMRREKEE